LNLLNLVIELAKDFHLLSVNVKEERERSLDLASHWILSEVLTIMNDRFIFFVESTNDFVKLLSMFDNPSQVILQSLQLEASFGDLLVFLLHLSDEREEIGLKGSTFFFHLSHCFVELVQVDALLLQRCLNFERVVPEMGFWERGNGLATPLVAQ
jgi:hypothetical protein